MPSDFTASNIPQALKKNLNLYMAMYNTLFVFRGNTQKRILGKINPKGPFDFLYGYDQFPESKSYIIAPRANRQSFLERLLYLYEKPFTLLARLGMPLEIYPLYKLSIKKSSVIICINDAISLGLLFYKMIGIIDATIIVLVQSLPERLKYFHRNKPLIWFISKLLTSSDKLLTLSHHAQRPLRTTFCVPNTKLSTFYFGVDTDYWIVDPDVKREQFIFSIGNDMNRDFETLIAALPDDLMLKLVTKHKVKTQGKKVEIYSDLSDAELRTLYQTCLFAVIPSKKLEYELSGLSCILQCMACGTPVITSYAPALNELFVEEVDISYYEPEDPVNLMKKIDLMKSDGKLQKKISKSAKEKVANKYNTKTMARQWETIIKDLST